MVFPQVAEIPEFLKNRKLSHFAQMCRDATNNSGLFAALCRGDGLFMVIFFEAVLRAMFGLTLNSESNNSML